MQVWKQWQGTTPYRSHRMQMILSEQCALLAMARWLDTIGEFPTDFIPMVATIN